MKDETFSREAKIDITVLIVLVGFALSVFFHYLQGAYLGRPYPYNTFLFLPTDVWADFFIVIRFNGALNPYLGAEVSPQYPFTNFLFYLFGLAGAATAFAIYLATLILAFYSFVRANLRTNNRYRWAINTFVLSFLTYPFLISLDRGNVDMLLFALLLFFTHFLVQKRYRIAILFLAPAIAMKAYPAVLLLLLIPDKKFKEIMAALGGALLLTVIPLLCFQGGFGANLKFLVAGANMDAPTAAPFLDETNMMQRGVSLFTILKIALIETGLIASVDMGRVLSAYIIVGALLFIPVAAYVVWVEEVFWKKLALLVFAMLLLPYFSGDYRLMHLFLPLFAFINSDQPSGLDRFYAIAFALLLIPKDYWLFGKVISDARVHDIGIAVLLNPALMLLLGAVIVWSGPWQRHAQI